MSTPQDFCSRVVDLDPMIRFAGIASIEGDIIAVHYRKGVERLLTEEESRLSIMQSLMRAAIRRTLEQKLGRTIYSIAVYEKVKRATISIFDSHFNRETGFLLVSVEKEANLEMLVTDKLLPMVENL